jgi:hypothetical protein
MKTELQVDADETNYMSREQNAELSHNIKIDNSSFGSVEEFRYLGTTLTNQSSIQGEIKRRMKLGNSAIIWYRIFCLPICFPKI